MAPVAVAPAMSADPEAIKRYYEYVDREAYDELFDLFADDVTYRRPGQEPIEGIDEFRRFYREVRTIERGTHAVDELIDDGETIAARGRFDGTLDGQQVEFGFVDVHRFNDDGEIESRWTYTDTGRV